MPDRLPRARTPFFGRSRELIRIRSELNDNRVVTLTGVGGSGKTRLALRVAEEAKPDLADEIVWIGLESLDDPRLVTTTACTALDVRLGT